MAIQDMVLPLVHHHSRVIGHDAPSTGVAVGILDVLLHLGPVDCRLGSAQIPHGHLLNGAQTWVLVKRIQRAISGFPVRVTPYSMLRVLLQWNLRGNGRGKMDKSRRAPPVSCPQPSCCFLVHGLHGRQRGERPALCRRKASVRSMVWIELDHSSHHRGNTAHGGVGAATRVFLNLTLADSWYCRANLKCRYRMVPSTMASNRSVFSAPDMAPMY